MAWLYLRVQNLNDDTLGGISPQFPEQSCHQYVLHPLHQRASLNF